MFSARGDLFGTNRFWSVIMIFITLLMAAQPTIGMSAKRRDLMMSRVRFAQSSTRCHR